MKKFEFGFRHRPAMLLSRMEEILRQTRVIDPVPSRKTLIRYLEEGTQLEGRKNGAGYWLVYEDSFRAWVRSHQPEDFALKS